MSKEVKRYTESCMEGGGVVPCRNGELVDWSAYEALLAERDVLKAELALWEPVIYEVHRRADKMCCLEDQYDFTVEIPYETYAAIDAGMREP